jgi:hypothetical protein
MTKEQLQDVLELGEDAARAKWARDEQVLAVIDSRRVWVAVKEGKGIYLSAAETRGLLRILRIPNFDWTTIMEGGDDRG